MQLEATNELRGNADQTAGGAICIWTPREAEALLSTLERLPGPFGIDCETRDVNPSEESPVHRGRIVCWSLSYRDPSLGSHSTRGIALARRCFIPNWGMYSQTLMPVFHRFLEKAPVVGHNIHSFDSHQFQNEGHPLGNIVGDTLRMSRLWWPSKDRPHDLKSLYVNCLGYEEINLAQFAYRQKHEMQYSQVMSKGEPVPFRHSKRKVGEQEKVSTLLWTGWIGKLYSGEEIIPLSDLVELYPERLPTLIDYSTLDSKATLELEELISAKMRTRPL